jgi:biopolymer transport protein TolR
MAMVMGSSHGNMADINVTPMIDILLVLLIIFMVIVPVTPRGLEALVPQPPKALQSATPNEAIVVQVIARPGQSPVYRINDTDVARTDLQPRLTEIFANRANRVMFVKADDAVDFASVADVMDIARSANVDHVGLMTPRVVAAR